MGLYFENNMNFHVHIYKQIGGVGLTLGKERAKSMLETFGARVTSAVSGKIYILMINIYIYIL
jgi:BRCT domain type II-containing protein